MDRQKTILSEYPKKKIRKNNVESSIEPPTAKSYSSVSGRFFHSGSHMVLVGYLGLKMQGGVCALQTFSFHGVL